MSDYPKIMKGTSTGVVINMIAPKVGTVVGLGNGLGRGFYTLGERRDDWVMSNFIPFKPKIVKVKEEV